MKKKLIIAAAMLCMVLALMPATTRASATHHFVAVNDALLPYGDATMPLISGGTIYVPYGVLSGAGVSSGATGEGAVRLQMGTKRLYVYADGRAEDQNGDSLGWPPALSSGGRVYVPLHQACEFFYLRYELIEVGGSVIPNVQIWIVRVITGSVMNRQDFVDRNKEAMIMAYNSYFKSAEPPPSNASPPPLLYSPPPEDEDGDGEDEPSPPPSYSDVTVYLSFHGLLAGGAGRILDIIGAAPYRELCCFFVGADDIREAPELIRRVSGEGHMLGIWLEECTLDEYNEIAALLFEAAKIKAVIITAGGSETGAMQLADAHGLIFWQATPISGDGEDDEFDEIAELLPTESGSRANLLFDCSERSLQYLQETLQFLHLYEYTIGRITETVTPTR